MNKPLFTVVIPCYNRRNTITRAIRSVFSQTYPYWNLLIIDDGSTDNSVEKIEPFLKDKRTTLYSLQENVGISKVLNYALSLVRTKYFIQLDSDDWFEKHALEELYRAIKKADGNTALFYGNVNWVEKEGNQFKLIRQIHHRNFKDKYDFLQYLTFMPQPRCYRTDAVRSVGGWDTDDPFDGRIMEDRRICLKLIEKYPFYWINKPLYNYRRHNDRLTSPASIEKRNLLRKLVVEKYLEKWGNEYTPDYRYDSKGYLRIDRLEKKQE